MLRALVCLLTLFAINTASANDSAIECTIKSFKHPELTKGANKATLCRDMIHALRAEFEDKISGSVTARVTGVAMYSVDFKFKATFNGVKYKGTGHEDWYPGDSYFTVDTIKRK